MDSTFQIFPTQASTIAPHVDLLFFYMLAVSTFFTGLIFLLIIYFTIRYRRRSEHDLPPKRNHGTALEITWTLVPFAIMLTFFFWGARLYARMKRPPENAMEIHVVGKQWMWKIQHPEGVREINELHVPTGRSIKLVMASQDVIHDFFIPAFRVKQDVVPGSYSTEWFVATRPGVYHIFCAQYCGTQHAQMVGRVIVMNPSDYQAWLAGTVPAEPPAASGARLFASYGCATCHSSRAPTLAGLYNTDVQVLDQRDNHTRTVKADEDYLRESIVYPDTKLVLGYPPIMPSYRGVLTEEQIFDLISYVKSLGTAMWPSQERLAPSTRPANGWSPDHAPNYPPVREPAKRGDRDPEYNP